LTTVYAFVYFVDGADSLAREATAVDWHMTLTCTGKTGHVLHRIGSQIQILNNFSDVGFHATVAM